MNDMAVDTPDPQPRPNSTDYSTCLIKPMGRNGDPMIELAHVIDAFLVGLLVFFAVLLGDVVPSLLAGNAAYLTVDEILARTPTGIISFGLAFIFQWLRARGIDVLEMWNTFRNKES